jgi:hypothetical protein
MATLDSRRRGLGGECDGPRAICFRDGDIAVDQHDGDIRRARCGHCRRGARRQRPAADRSLRLGRRMVMVRGRMASAIRTDQAALNGEREHEHNARHNRENRPKPHMSEVSHRAVTAHPSSDEQAFSADERPVSHRRSVKNSRRSTDDGGDASGRYAISHSVRASAVTLIPTNPSTPGANWSLTTDPRSNWKRRPLLAPRSAL